MLAEARETREAVELRHPHVEEHDVGIRLAHDREHALPTETSDTISKSSASASARRTAASMSRWSSATSTRKVPNRRSPFRRARRTSPANESSLSLAERSCPIQGMSASSTGAGADLCNEVDSAFVACLADRQRAGP